ncbi:CENP-Q- a CENPA-CAD centromere complex subunit-domain-containing protein [Apiospora arundinis]
MAPETANQKRKRGRGANASQDNEIASQTQSRSATQEAIAQTNGDAEVAEPEEDARPRKRGRPAKTTQPEPEPQPEPEVTSAAPEPVADGAPTAKRKRGRPSLTNGNNGSENAESATPEVNGQPGPKKGGRKAASQQQPVPDTVSNEPEIEGEQAQPKRRGRPPKATAVPNEPEVEADEADDENEGNSSLLRRSGRERRKPGGKVRQDATEDATNEEEPEAAGDQALPRTAIS